MKQSGSLLSFALYGAAAQAFYIIAGKFFFAVGTPIVLLAVHSFFVVWAFVALRLIMDWEQFDNPIEDYLRETYISQDSVDKLAFAFLGGAIMFIGNPLFWSLGPKGFMLAMVSVSFFQNVHESVRVMLYTRDVAATVAGGE